MIDLNERKSPLLQGGDNPYGDGGSGGGGGKPPWWDPWRDKRASGKAIEDILAALPPGLRQNGIQGDEFHWVDPDTLTVYELRQDKDGNPVWGALSDADSKRWLKNAGVPGIGSDAQRLVSDDPRYWDLQYQQLYQDAINMGLDAESARRQALATLITNRNNTAVDVANTSANVAKTIAEFAANPRDAVAELMYRNQVGGSTSFGDLTNDNFGAYGKALAEKAASIFQPVGQDIQQARIYRDSIPPVDFLGSEQRSQLGLPPTAAQSLVGSSTGPAPATAAPVNGLQALMDRLNSFSDTEKNDFRKWVTAANGGIPPTTAEDGVNMNIMEEAAVVGKSGRIYATLAEGDVPEQLIVKPLPSVKERMKKEKEGSKSFMQATQGAQRMADGGSATATPDDFMEQLRQYLGSLGGAGGGTGSFGTPLPSLRLLAGEPANRLSEDPVALDYALAGYSGIGIDPRTVAATIKKFTPTSAQYQNIPRVSF